MIDKLGDKKYVLDTSVIVKWYDQSEEYSAQAISILDMLLQSKIRIFLPVLAIYEVGNVFVRAKGLKHNYCKTALSNFLNLPIIFQYTTTDFVKTTTTIAKSTNTTFYDASFMATAFLNDCKLITANFKHQGGYNRIQTIDLKNVIV